MLPNHLSFVSVRVNFHARSRLANRVVMNGDMAMDSRNPAEDMMLMSAPAG